jgi:hypothetical protein
MGLAFDRHLPLGHRFKERTLGSRRRAIDFVGKEHIGKDRAGAKLKFA